MVQSSGRAVQSSSSWPLPLPTASHSPPFQSFLFLTSPPEVFNSLVLFQPSLFVELYGRLSPDLCESDESLSGSLYCLLNTVKTRSIKFPNTIFSLQSSHHYGHHLACTYHSLCLGSLFRASVRLS